MSNIPRDRLPRCTFPGCTNGRRYKTGLCDAHQRQWNNTGELWKLGTKPYRGGMPGRIGSPSQVAEEVEFLLPGSPVNIATRLGYKNPESLYRALLRAKRLDLWRRMRESA